MILNDQFDGTHVQYCCVPGYPCTCILVVKSVCCLFNMIMKKLFSRVVCVSVKVVFVGDPTSLARDNIHIHVLEILKSRMPQTLQTQLDKMLFYIAIHFAVHRRTSRKQLLSRTSQFIACSLTLYGFYYNTIRCISMQYWWYPTCVKSSAVITSECYSSIFFILPD